ncbi:MAG: SGNH/GDSL hydrolase family protein [Patescibacteria group bacterium]|nr:SGNH/GDSL hydrolase family protein [Patescibacteria group bacterium]
MKTIVQKDELFSIVFYGASTTSVEYSFPNWGEIIRYWLKEYIAEKIGKYYWNLQTANRGLYGAGSQELLDRFEVMVENLDAKLIILQIGKNDFYYKIDKSITENNTRKIIQKSLEKNMLVVFTTSVPPATKELSEKIKEYAEVDRKVAKEFAGNENFMFIDFYNFFSEEDLERSYTLISEGGNVNIGIIPGGLDPVHFNKHGNALIAKIILKESFGIDFDHNKFIQDLSDNTKKYPGF